MDTVANMPIANRNAHGQSATVGFKRTPKMPSYLVVYTGGDLRECPRRAEAHDSASGRSRPEEDGETALASAQEIPADYNDYFAYPFPLPKLDSIAVPGGFSGAMENWGAITYNDQLLQVTPASNMQETNGVRRPGA